MKSTQVTSALADSMDAITNDYDLDESDVSEIAGIFLDSLVSELTSSDSNHPAIPHLQTLINHLNA